MLLPFPAVFKEPTTVLVELAEFPLVEPCKSVGVEDELVLLFEFMVNDVTLFNNAPVAEDDEEDPGVMFAPPVAFVFIVDVDCLLFALDLRCLVFVWVTTDEEEDEEDDVEAATFNVCVNFNVESKAADDDVAFAFKEPSISFSGDEAESEDASWLIGLYGGIVFTLPLFFSLL